MMKVLLGRYIIELLLYHERRSKIRFECIHTGGDSVFKCSGKDGLLRYLTQLLPEPEF